MTTLTTTDHQRLLDENAELHCRIQELEAENEALEAERDELLERAEEREWERKDDKPEVDR